MKSDDDSSSDGGAVRSDDNDSKTDDEDVESANKVYKYGVLHSYSVRVTAALLDHVEIDEN